MSIYSRFPEFNAEEISNFISQTTITRISVDRVLRRVRNFQKHFGYDLSSFSSENFLSIQQRLVDRLSRIKHPSVIDRSLFSCFSDDSSSVESAYQKMCSGKIKKALKSLTDDPNLRKGASFEFQVSRYGKEKAESRYSTFIHKQKLASRRCVEFYLDRGFDLASAEKAVSEFQVKFSLEICIEKHGEVEGTKIWKDRQERWQAALNAKAPSELARINKMKGIHLDHRFLGKENCYFYVLLIDNGDVKVGITTKESPEQRFAEEAFDVAEFYYLMKDRGALVAEVEYLTKVHFLDSIISKEEMLYEHFGYTETIRGVPIEEIVLKSIEIANKIDEEPRRTR